MKAINPFQIPACFQELQDRRRARVKKTVMAVVIGLTLLLMGLLIEGCVSEHAKTTSATRASAMN